jgi:starch synthase
VLGSADLLLVPSRFEPCGLTQIYSLRYGTVPLVRRTGGLADTVVDTNLRTAIAQTATGFVFDDPTPQALLATIHRAVDYYRRPRRWWHSLMSAGMQQDYSWRRSAEQYLELYRRLRPQPLGPD